MNLAKLKKHTLADMMTTIGVCLYLSIPFVSILFENYKNIETAAALLCVFCAICVLTFSKAAKIKVPTLFGLLLLFYIYVVLNNNAIFESGSGLTWFMLFLCSIILVLALLANPNQKWVDISLQLISGFGCVYSFATIIFWVIPDLYNLIYPFLRSLSSSEITGAGYKSGLTTHYSTNGMYIALGFLASGCLGLKRQNKRWRYIAILCLFALILTSKRAHLAFGLVSFVIAYFVYNSRKSINSFGKLLFVSAISICVMYLVSFVNSDVLDVFARFSEMSSDDTMNGRSGFYTLCIDMFRSSPLTGHGWGSYTIRFNQTGEGARYYAGGFKTMNAHNVYLQILAEEGLLGCIILFTTLFVALYIGVRQLLKLNRLFLLCCSDCINNYRTLLAASIGLQLFFLMYCFTGNPLYDMQMYIPYLFALGIECSVNYRIKTLSNAKILAEVKKPTGIGLRY